VPGAGAGGAGGGGRVGRRVVAGTGHLDQVGVAVFARQRRSAAE